MRVAIISTVFNRKEKTERAIRSLTNAISGFEYRFYICDDKSTDGTKEMLQNLKCSITVIEGNGDLFWSRGMYKAMEKAAEDEADLYLLINDDVEFFPNVMQVMMDSYKMAGIHCGIVGSTKSLKTDTITYGGRKLKDQQLINPNGSIQPCDLTNWNCFLIDDFVMKKIGLIDDYYEHALGDFDYSLRMKKSGIPVYIATDYVGYCENNTKKGTYHDKDIPRSKRFKLMISRRNMPIKSRWHYYMKNFGFGGVKDFLWPYIKCSMCIILGKEY